MAAHWDSVTYVFFQALKQHLTDVTSFRISKSLYPRPILFKRTNNFGSVI